MFKPTYPRPFALPLLILIVLLFLHLIPEVLASPNLQEVPHLTLFPRPTETEAETEAETETEAEAITPSPPLPQPAQAVSTPAPEAEETTSAHPSPRDSPTASTSSPEASLYADIRSLVARMEADEARLQAVKAAQPSSPLPTEPPKPAPIEASRPQPSLATVEPPPPSESPYARFGLSLSAFALLALETHFLLKH